MIAVISHIVTDNIIIGFLRCFKFSEKDKPSPLNDDKMSRFGPVKQLLEAHEYLKALFVLNDCEEDSPSRFNEDDESPSRNNE